MQNIITVLVTSNVNPSHRSSGLSDEFEDESSEDSDVETANETDGTGTSKHEDQKNIVLKETLTIDDNAQLSADINILSTEGVISNNLTCDIKDL